MFCPTCGSQDSGESNFCKRCGTNLRRVMQLLSGSQHEDGEESFVRKLTIQQEFLQDLEVMKKRKGMLTGGIIAACAGFGMMVFLTALEGPKAGMVGIVPLMVGVGLILSAQLVFNPKKAWPTRSRDAAHELDPAPTPATIRAPQPNPPETITAQTTRHLDEVRPPSRLVE